MKLPVLGELRPWHGLAAAVLTGLAWRALGAPGRTTMPAGDEEIQLRIRGYALPAEYMHWSPVSWAGRSHPYPGGVGEGISALMDKSAPDWADCDR